MSNSLTIGVLALQGAFAEHYTAISHLSSSSLSESSSTPTLNPIFVRTPADLDQCDALIIPGGESTTMAIVARTTGILQPLKEFVNLKKKPVWGTCAGAILLSEKVVGAKKGGQEVLGGIGITIGRNAFGSQIESFEAALEMESSQTLKANNEDFVGVFIRAPIVLEIHSPDVKPLAKIPSDILNSEDNDPRRIAALRQGDLMLTTFHPELTEDYRFHEYFIKEVVLPYYSY